MVGCFVQECSPLTGLMSHRRRPGAGWAFLVMASCLMGWPMLTGATQKSYLYLKCYQDDPTSRDLNGIGYSLGIVRIEDCATKCRLEGYPYVGLQNGQQCFCGMTYGKHGITSAYKCNETCDQQKCGGYHTNSVYYTVPVDSTSISQRILEGHGEEKTFIEARQTCVRYNGDLAHMRNATEISNAQAAAKEANASGTKFWFGLRKVDSRFAWTNAMLGDLKFAETTSFWVDGETHQLSCVVFDTETGKWETTSCSASYPFICHQVPTPPTEPPTTAGPDDGSGEEEGSFFSRQTKITMYVIIPLFFFCYGGSCLLYAIHKCYKAFRRRQRRKEHQAHLTEFEPDTKPFSLGGGGRVTPVQPLTSRDVDLQEEPRGGGTLTPQPCMPAAVPPYRKDKPDRPVHTPVMDFKPEHEPPRALTPAEQRAESRRARLLQNALNEARERKRGDSPRPPSQQDRPSSDSSNEFPRPPTGPPRKQKPPSRQHGRGDSDASNDSMSLLLPQDNPRPDADAVIDFTKLSIQDIIQIKQLMGQAKKTKPKKILSA